MSASAGVFVGRDRELEHLAGLLDGARAGRGAVVEISGEAGIGKTRLAEEVAARATHAGWRVAWGRGSNLAGAPPYLPWTMLIEALDKAEPERIAGGAVPSLFPTTTDAMQPETRPATPWELVDALRGVLTDRSRGQPLLLVLDDAQWFEAASHRLLGGLASAIGQLPLLALVCRRTEEKHSIDTLADALLEASRAGVLSHVPLAGLAPSEVAAYITGTLGVPVAAQLAPSLSERTGGNPYFLSELAAYLRATPSPLDAAVGTTEGIRGTLARGLSVLSSDARERLVFAALLGGEFSLADWGIATDAPRNVLVEDAESLLAVRAISETGAGVYRFAHDLMREAALEGVSETRRAELHGLLGQRLEQVPGRAFDVGMLAWHFREGARLDSSLAAPALAYSLEAGEQANRAGAWERTIAHLTDCLELMEGGASAPRADRAAILLMRGSARRAAADGRASFRDLMTAAAAFRERGDWTGQAQAALEASRLWAPEARKLAVLDEALGASGQRDRQLEAQTVTRRARIAGTAPAPAIARALELVEKEPPAAVLAEIAALRGRTAFLARDFVAAAPLLHEAWKLFDSLGHASDAVAMLTDEQDCYLMGGEYQKARDYFETVIAYARRTGQRVEEHIWLGDSGAFATLAGDIDFARRRASEASSTVAYPAFAARVAVAEFTDETANLAEEMPTVESVGGVANLAVHILELRARAREIEGDIEGAKAEIEACMRLPLEDLRTGHACGNGQGVVETLAPEALVRHWYEAFQREPQIRAVIWASADRMRGALALRLGLLDDAERHLRCGLEWCEANAVLVEAARCHADLAEVAMQRGQVYEAESLLSRARKNFEAYGATGYARRAAERLASLHVLPSSPAALPSGLSAREAEVLGLMAAGMTNRAIAERLVVSPNTVANHVKHILNKTGLANRTEAAAFAVRHGLTPPSAST